MSPPRGQPGPGKPCGIFTYSMEVLAGVQADMTGAAVGLLREAGISAEVRMASDRLSAAMGKRHRLVDSVLVPAVEADRAREVLAEGGFPIQTAATDEAAFEGEAAATAPGDDSVRAFLGRKA